MTAAGSRMSCSEVRAGPGVSKSGDTTWQPIFVGSRAQVADVAGVRIAGEDRQIVADEHGVSIDDVRVAARPLGHAA